MRTFVLAQITFGITAGGKAAKPQQVMLMLISPETGAAAYVVAKAKKSAYSATLSLASLEKQIGKSVSASPAANCCCILAMQATSQVHTAARCTLSTRSHKVMTTISSATQCPAIACPWQRLHLAL